MGIDECIHWAHKERFDRLVAGIRTQSNDGDIAVLEVVIAKGKEFAFQREGIVDAVTKAYCVALIIEGGGKGYAKIIPATYRQGVFDAKLALFTEANAIKLDQRIVEAAHIEDPLNNLFVPLMEMARENFAGYFRQNCYSPQKG